MPLTEDDFSSNNFGTIKSKMNDDFDGASNSFDPFADKNFGQNNFNDAPPF